MAEPVCADRPWPYDAGMSRLWTFAHVIVLVSVVLFVLALCAAMGWFGITNVAAWMAVGLAVFAASFLPWRTRSAP